MTIDRAIKDLKGKFSSPYNNQLAEWLEELKELREVNRTLSLGEGHFITEDNLNKSIDNAYLKGYNKAVDDTIKAIKEEYAFTILEEEKIDEIAEQLKGAKQNEDFK